MIEVIAEWIYGDARGSWPWFPIDAEDSNNAGSHRR
jgi:hypothetical protein